MVEECERTGCDGIDIDFEGWPAETRFAFTDFIAQLSEALHARGKMLSICTYALSPEARREVGIGFWDTSVLAQYADHIRAMTYDMYCPPSLFVGPTSCAPWGRETMGYMSTQVPRHKIVMGLPTYSVDWDMNEPSRSRQVSDYRWIAEREKESPIGRGWCYWMDVNLIRYTDEEKHEHLLWVSDAQSTRSHLVTVDSLDLSGICFWLMHEGADPAIFGAVRDHFKR
jgi:spore germination protein YaaH